MQLPRFLRIGAAVEFCMHQAETRKALYLLAVISALESAILPIPVHAVLVPMMLASRRRIWLVMLVATVASVIGGVGGYFIGYFGYETIGVWLLDLYGLTDTFQEYRTEFATDLWTGATFVFIGALTPIPYKVVCIAAGFMAFDLATFILVSVVGRTLQFGFFAVLLYAFGPKLKALMDRNSTLFGYGVIAIVILGFVAIKFLL